jgi:hypothetical protein
MAWILQSAALILRGTAANENRRRDDLGKRKRKMKGEIYSVIGAGFGK